MLRIFTLLFFLLLHPFIFAQIPAPKGWVNDFEDILTISEEKILDSTIRMYKKKTGREIAIVTRSNIGKSSDVASFCLELFNRWGIGEKKHNNGLLIFVSSALRETRITTGIGTEKILTNDICKKVIDEIMLPHFREKKYFLGIEKGMNALIKKWK